MSGHISTALKEDIQKARIELYKLIKEKGFIEPDRGNLDDENIRWKFGKPDYTIANLLYLKGKSQNHAAGSLEQIVENLVKAWEMDASHKPYDQWGTINKEKYWVQANGGKVFSGKESAELGNYNWLLASCKKHLYDYSKETFESSHNLFRGAFPAGFGWEVLDVFSPPPKVAFTWRHWANFSGSYKENVGKNETVNLFGFTIATLDENGKICSLEVFSKNDEFLEIMEGTREPEEVKFHAFTSKCPMSKSK